MLDPEAKELASSLLNTVIAQYGIIEQEALSKRILLTDMQNMILKWAKKDYDSILLVENRNLENDILRLENKIREGVFNND